MPGAPVGSVASSAPAAPAGADPPGAGPPAAVPPPEAGGPPRPIALGLSYNATGDETADALGLGITTGDQQRLQETMVAWVNAHGGLGGHPLEPVFHVLRSTDGGTAETAAQAMCDTWFSDHAVDGVATLSTMDIVRQCAHDAGAAQVQLYTFGDADDDTFATFPHWVEVAHLSMDALARAYVDGIAAQGYFQPAPLGPPVIGLLRTDNPGGERVAARSLAPALERHGAAVASEFAYPAPRTTQELSGLAGSMANAVLQFRSAGVTHVLFLAPEPYGPAVFMTQADGQRWEPRYGLHSYLLPQVGIESGLMPPGQVDDAAGIGWLPSADVGDQPDAHNATTDLCLSIFAEQGIVPADANALGVALIYCDLHLVTKAVYDAMPDPLDRAGFLPTLEAISTSLETGIVGPVRLAPDRHAGVTQYRSLAFAGDCGCFTYTGPAQPVSG